jgi:hypothetical protein
VTTLKRGAGYFFGVGVAFFWSFLRMSAASATGVKFPGNGTFHVMWKSPIPGNSRYARSPGERRLLADFPAMLRTMLPVNWSVEIEEEPVTRIRAEATIRPDAILTIHAPDGNEAKIIVEAKQRLSPRDSPIVVSQLRRYQEVLGGEASGLVVAAYLPARTRELLTDAMLSYADVTGNVRLALDHPSVFIYTTGAPADPWPTDTSRPLRSLKGPTASRVVRALVDFRPPFGVQQLAERSSTSLSSVSRVFTFLEQEGLILREPYGPVTEVRWGDLIRRWTEDYSFSRSNLIRTYLEPRGLPALLDKLKAIPSRYAVTGSLAATTVAPIAAPRLATIYVDDAAETADRLRLRPTEAGTNVILAEPFDSVAYDRSCEIGGVRYAAPSQVAADLLTGPGRSPAEGEELIQWMQEHEDAWRH